MTQHPSWHEFDIVSPNGPSIPLHQIEESTFALGDVTITYNGTTGLEHLVPHRLSAELHERIRTITPAKLPTTDLASVPGPMRWFANTFGDHTPAALIHDYLIVEDPADEEVPAEWADRYFRFMLKSCGVPFFMRSIMWTGVAMRTRLHAPELYKRVLLFVWVAAALLGMGTFAVSTQQVLSGSGEVFGLSAITAWWGSVVAPFVVSWLWGKQVLAGVITAAAAPWLLPISMLAAVGWGIYWTLEGVGTLFARAARRLGISTVRVGTILTAPNS